MPSFSPSPRARSNSRPASSSQSSSFAWWVIRREALRVKRKLSGVASTQPSMVFSLGIR